MLSNSSLIHNINRKPFSVLFLIDLSLIHSFCLLTGHHVQGIVLNSRDLLTGKIKHGPCCHRAFRGKDKHYLVIMPNYEFGGSYHTIESPVRLSSYFISLDCSILSLRIMS